MSKLTIAEKVDWMKGALDVLSNTALDSADPMQGLSRQYLDMFNDWLTRVMDTLYGDGEEDGQDDS